ncbi:uncharacterized protein LOC128244754 isoform X1 [Mya arenaria]|uniref:uncharacterized protein LOC128244754 isoform X1 n=1 Tax=Mya arenaria TaxID=6604 RepID=UPI0022E01A47|nr:uncharacterized protein LOC128244754 isoform X1 [Mya arenaria]XP_052818771.1 uncharacterized protein LOC128244754 isoform X1 [Mya arenaria]XP_052818772.1 uncharacterized protein LOC128244754 isoform X1 [Mya arenaria]
MEVLNKLKEDLARFPSLFDCEGDIEKAVRNKKSNILSVTARLELELTDENDMYSKTLFCRTHNLLTFLYVLLEDYEKATEHLRESEKVELSLIAISNRAYMNLKRQENILNIKADIQLLEEKYKIKEMVLVAKAEKGHAFTRFGMQLYEKAVAFFSEVLKESQPLQTESSCLRWKENICVWSFSLAMTKKRMSHMTNNLDACKLPVENYKEIFKLYQNIVNTDGAAESPNLKTAKGRALAEIGLLAQCVERNKSDFKRGLKDFFPAKKTSSVDFIDRAVALSKSDAFVLQRCGKYYRYISNQQVSYLRISIDLLQRAVAIKPTSYACHHLALSLMRDLEMESNRPGSAISTKNDHVRRLDFHPTHGQSLGTLVTAHSYPQGTPGKTYDSGLGIYSGDNPRCPFKEKIIAQQSSAETTNSNQQGASGMNNEPGYSLPSEFRNMSLESPGSNSRVSLRCSFQERTNRPQSGMDHQTLESETFDRHDSQNKMKYRGVHGEHLSSSSLQKNSTQHTIRKKQFGRYPDHNYEYQNLQSEQYGRYDTRNNYRGYRGQISQRYNRSFSEGQQYDRGRGFHCNSRQRYFRSRSMVEKTYLEPPREKVRIMQMIKSPQKPPHINPEVSPVQAADIHILLDKAIKMDNVAALYDKGLYHRQLGDASKALDAFKTMFNNKRCSLVLLSNAYEQAALCIAEKLESSDTTDTELRKTDMVQYLKSCVEISCYIVAENSLLKDCWKAAPTLEQFLKREGKTEPNLKELCFLYEKMKNYDGAIEILKDLETIVSGEGEKIDIINKLIKNYFMKKDYNSAVLESVMIMRFPDGHNKVDENLYLQVHIEGAFHALTKGETEMARLRLRNALDFNLQSLSNTGAQNLEDECTSDEYDIFVLCETEETESRRFFIGILKSMGLSVTLNVDDLLPGRNVHAGLTRFMKSSKHYITLLSSDQPTPELKHRYSMLRGVLEEKETGSLIVITTNSDVHVPTSFKTVPQLTLSFEELFEEGESISIQDILSSVPIRQCFKDIFMKLSEKPS